MFKSIQNKTINFNSLNGTPIHSDYLTRDLVKESIEGHREHWTNNKIGQIKYLYVIGKKIPKDDDIRQNNIQSSFGTNYGSIDNSSSGLYKSGAF